MVGFACCVTMAHTRLFVTVVFLHCGLCYPSVGGTEVFYVKPTNGSTTNCSSGDFPCHTLQDYASNSSFTNNSMFLFLEGEHHLETMVYVDNVTNLSLVGNGSGVEILCKSTQSGFFIKGFAGLDIKNMNIVDCSGIGAALRLETGSDANVDHVMMVPTSGSTGLTASDVGGSFTVANCIFIANSETKNRLWLVQYDDCSRASHFKYINNTAIKMGNFSSIGVSLALRCSGVIIEITGSVFESNYQLGILKMTINYAILANNSILVSNSEFRDTEIIINTCHGNHCDVNAHECNQDFISFRKVTTNSGIGFHVLSPLNNCTIFIEDSEFSDRPVTSSPISQLTFDFGYDPDKSENDTSIQALLRGVTFANNQNPENALCILRNAVILLNDCNFENNTYSAIQAFWSKVIFEGTNAFKNNTSPVGGGIQFLESLMYLSPNTSILFENNHAYYVGGAIYTDYKEEDLCFFYVDPLTFNNSVIISFVNNTADFSGSSIYGGGINHCCLSAPCVNFSDIFDINNTESDPSAIASDPYDVCFCDDGMRQPNCSNRSQEVSAYRGQEIAIRLAVVGTSLDGVVPGVIRAYFDPSDNVTLGQLQNSQAGDRPRCEDFYYLVSSGSTDDKLTLYLNAEQTFFKELTRVPELGGSTSSLTVTVTLMGCPTGFWLPNDACVCDQLLKDNNIECDINNQSFLRLASTWIGFINESSSVPGILFHRNCPIGYCLPNDINITSSTGDCQCEPYRTGLLCGECDRAEDYSLMLGNGKCDKCSNIYLLLTLPLAIAGLLLVAIIFALDLTVTEGSINGLIFYANVIGMNYNILLSGGKSSIYWFVAWLNLDLGISTCLYDGMDGYAETWLQFVFPVYLWVIILVIIKLYSRFPVLANRLGGENAVKVLATLLLLSYTKLQRTVVTILSYTKLEYPDGVVRYVWLYDANVEFFKGKHLYLGIVGILVLVLLIVPYTLCLAFFQQLQACSGHRLFQWVNKLKPVFDAYAGPYKDKYRFWTGMLLVVRTLLIILFTANTAGSADFNLLIILVISFTLLVAHANGTYKKWTYNYLEAFFYLQLGVFAAGIAYSRVSNGNTTAVADTSFGLSLFIFLIVVGYHVVRRLTFVKKCYYLIKGYDDIINDLSHDRMITESDIVPDHQATNTITY